MPIVLVPIYNHIVFFRFFEDVSHIDKVFLLLPEHCR